MLSNNLNLSNILALIEVYIMFIKNFDIDIYLSLSLIQLIMNLKKQTILKREN